jgi:hypothetical protein
VCAGGVATCHAGVLSSPGTTFDFNIRGSSMPCSALCVACCVCTARSSHSLGLWPWTASLACSYLVYTLALASLVTAAQEHYRPTNNLLEAGHVAVLALFGMRCVEHANLQTL